MITSANDHHSSSCGLFGHQKDMCTIFPKILRGGGLLCQTSSVRKRISCYHKQAYITTNNLEPLKVLVFTICHMCLYTTALTQQLPCVHQ